MLFKKIAIAAAVATTLAFVGCSGEKKTAETKAASESVVASEAQTASDVAVATASEVKVVAASEVKVAASQVDAAPVASQAAH